MKIDRRTFVYGLGSGGLLSSVAISQTMSRVGSQPRAGSARENLLDHGVAGDGKRLDDAAFQAAVDALPPTGGQIIIPPGTFLRSVSTQTRGKPVVFQGAGRSVCFLKVGHPSNDILVHTGEESAEFRDFTVFSSVQRTGGVYIRLDPGAGKINYSSAVERVRMYGHYIGIDLARCSDARLRDCSIIGNKGSEAAVLVRNLTDPDSGDNSISGCFFSGAGGAGIRQESSGGLRVTDNKFNGLVDSFVLSLQIERRSTSILLIQGNSFENAYRYNIRLERGRGQGVFTYGVITGNQFGYTPIAFSVKGDGATFFDFLISQNVFAVPKGGVGVELDGGHNFQVKDNIFHGVVGDATAIAVTAAERNPHIGDALLRNIVGGNARP